MSKKNRHRGGGSSQPPPGGGPSKHKTQEVCLPPIPHPGRPQLPSVVVEDEQMRLAMGGREMHEQEMYEDTPLPAPQPPPPEVSSGDTPSGASPTSGLFDQWCGQEPQPTDEELPPPPSQRSLRFAIGAVALAFLMLIAWAGKALFQKVEPNHLDETNQQWVATPKPRIPPQRATSSPSHSPAVPAPTPPPPPVASVVPPAKPSNANVVQSEAAEELKRKLADASQDRKNVEERLKALAAERDQLKTERDSLKAERDRLKAEKERRAACDADTTACADAFGGVKVPLLSQNGKTAGEWCRTIVASCQTH